MLNQQRNGRAGQPLHVLDRIVHLHHLGRDAVDFQDQVSRAHAGPVRRAVIDRADHAQLIRFGRTFHHHADPDELLINALLELLKILRSDVVGVLVQFADHSSHGVFEQFARLDFLDVVVLDDPHGVRDHGGKAIMRGLFIADQRDNRDDHDREYIAKRHTDSPASGPDTDHLFDKQAHGA